VALDNDILTRLLGSIEANRLILLCGAGLSIPSPSNLMSAVGVSRACYDKYQPIAVLPTALRDNIDLLAGHFYARGEFESVFLGSLVPWNELVGEPNPAHAAVADFLITRVASAALSANFDVMIERWATGLKVDMRGALDGQEAVTFSDQMSPLVKFHGCLVRDRTRTLWTQEQCNEAAVSQRINLCSQWMHLNLPGKDLLVVGFWTDWGYLNDVLAEAMATAPFKSVTVIDPQTTTELQAKAPMLWTRLTGSGATPFQHIQHSGAEALEELRTAFSRVWGRKFYALGKLLLESAGRACPPDSAVSLETMECEDLYTLRRDAEGVPYSRAARMKEPPAESAQAAFAHLLLIEASAERAGAWFVHGGKSVRIVHGGGQGLSTVRARYVEPTSAPQADIVVCAGAVDLGVPGYLIPSGRGTSVVRPGGGGGSRWLTLEQAQGELGL
jgi:hypothetical protein